MNGILSLNQRGDCLLGGQLLHPAQGALEAAVRDLRSLLERAEPGDLLILAGPGLGWHALAAEQRAPQLTLLVFEPDSDRLHLLKNKGVLPAGVRIAESRAELAAHLGELVVYKRAGWVTVYSPRVYAKQLPQLAETAQKELDEAIKRGQVDRANLRAKKKLWLHNLRDNFYQILKLPDLGLLGGVMSGLPALIVGAGPSLDQSLPHLRGAGERGLVLCGASAMNPLAGIGLRPHLSMALEGKDESRQFSRLEVGDCVLAASSFSHPNHFALYPGKLALFHTQVWLAEMLGFGPHLPTGGHVTSAAFSLACLWGCDPIIVVGQDLAFSQGRMHASGRPGGENYDAPELVEVEAIGGGMTKTNVVMEGYITWYREAAAHLKKWTHPPRMINATAEGARLQDFEEMPLEQALSGLQGSGIDSKFLPAAMDQIPRPNASYLAMRLARCKAEVKQARNALKEKGIELFRSELNPKNAANFLLADLPRSVTETDITEQLDTMDEALNRMEEAIHGRA